jgi:hypothetical protein
MAGPVEDDEIIFPLRDDAVRPMAWHEQAPHAVNSDYLMSFFEDTGYRPPRGAEILIGKVVSGLNQPAYQLYDLEGSAFSHSFWPASTVKLLACLGALDFLATKKLTGKALAVIHYPDAEPFKAMVRKIYTLALRISSNPDYDRCVEIAGFDRLNQVFLSPENGFPTTVLQRRYGKAESLRVSPPMELVEGKRTVSVPQRIGKGEYPCADEGNCTSLFELLEGLRRVMLHDEIPAFERFNISPGDVKGLHAALLASKSKFQFPAMNVFGQGAVIHNKTGFVPGDDLLDHGMIEDPATGDRYLVAVAVPSGGGASLKLVDLVDRALMAVYLSDADRAMPWQHDAGLEIRVQLDDEGMEDGLRRMRLSAEVEGADRIRVWIDTEPVGEAEGGPGFVLEAGLADGGEKLLVVQAWAGGEPAGYRALAVFIPPP